MSLNEQVLAIENDIKEIKLRMHWQRDKPIPTQIMILEDCVLKLVGAIEVLLEAKEKKLWPV